LDASEFLSVQVHPSDHNHKTEAWYILDARPDSFIYKGLKKGVDRRQLESALQSASVEQLLNRIPAKPGQHFFLPSGTVHALGPGILVAEIQTPSDTTYRLFDFNRIDPSTGKPRQLHIEQALDS